MCSPKIPKIEVTVTVIIVTKINEKSNFKLVLWYTFLKSCNQYLIASER